MWLRRVIPITGLLLLVLIAAKWPFARERILDRLGGALSSDVKSSKFRLIFFPHPGCILEDVVVSRREVQLARVRRLTLESSWVDLLTLRRDLRFMGTDGLVIELPFPVPAGVHRPTSGSSTSVNEARFDGAVLNVAGRRFEFRELRLRNLGSQERLTLGAWLRHPEPPGDLRLSGSMGPWAKGETPVDGSYELTAADLGKYRGIAGTLVSKGLVRGTLAKMAVNGTAGVDDFQVTSSRHSQALQTTFGVIVNAMNGDVILESVEARFGETVLHSAGTVANKTAAINFVSRKARVEDLLYMFTKNDRPSLRGPVVLKARVVLPPDGGKFLERLRLDGDFSIRQARFTKPTTQMKLNKLSGRARNDSEADEQNTAGAPEQALTDLRAHVAMRNGIARLSGVGFHVPGAAASGAGTYNLLSKWVDIRGEVKMEATVSQATGGIKGAILKPFNFLFRRKYSNAGAILPVSITGKYPRPRFQVRLKPAD